MMSGINVWNWIITCVITLRMAPSMYYMNSFRTWTHLLNELNYEDHHSSMYLSYVLAYYRWIHWTPIMFRWTHLLNEFIYPAKTRSWQMVANKQEAENNGCLTLNQKMKSSKNLTKRKIYSSYNNRLGILQMNSLNSNHV